MKTLDAMLPDMDAVSITRYGIIYLRLSDFRNEDDDGTFTAREQELRELAKSQGLTVRDSDVVIENDTEDDGTLKSASAYKTPKKIQDGNGVITRRTNREKFTRVLLALQRSEASVLIAGDESRISRDWRDARDLLDVCQATGASVLVPDDDGEAKWVLRHGGSPREVAAFMDKVNDSRKYSDQVAANTRKGRRRWVGKSWQGGPRPFGFRVEQGTEEHKRNLVIDMAECRVLCEAATAILDQGISLIVIARGLSEATGDEYVPTVSGARWSPSTLKDMLAKPATAGLQRRKDGTLTEAPWDAIIPRARWEKLVALFESRKTGHGNEPRWLCSLIATCGVCGNVVKCTGGAKRRAYACVPHGHVRRNAVRVDETVRDKVLALLKTDAPHLLVPKPKVNADTGKLRDEAKRLTDKADDLARLFGEGILTEAGVRAERKRIDARLTQIGAELAASDVADPLPEFRDPDADVLQVWDSLGLARQRSIVRRLYDITILPAKRGGNVFDPDSVQMRRRS